MHQCISYYYKYALLLYYIYILTITENPILNIERNRTGKYSYIYQINYLVFLKYR